MEKFKSPKLLITDHYDEVIRKVDIYTEELLEKYDENDLLPYYNEIDYNSHEIDLYYEDDRIKKIERFKNPYFNRWIFEYKYDLLHDLDVRRGKILVRDYLELVRSKTIDELKKAQQHNLDNYELNKDLYKYDRKTLTDEKVEEMRQNLFKDKFAFVVSKIKLRKHQYQLKTYTILTDFYLDENDIQFLKRLLRMESIQLINDIESDNVFKYILDEKSLIVYLVREFIIGIYLKFDYANEIISITKSALLEIRRVKIDYMLINYVNLPSIDFSFIKSMTLSSRIYYSKTLNEIRDLSGLKQLEYLRIRCMRLTANSFNGLGRLIKLELEECYISEERLCFDSLISLEFLKIENLCFLIDLKPLGNLKVLLISRARKLTNIINVSESITHLQLNSLDYMSKADDFYSRVFLPNLVYLNLNNNELSNIKKQWIRGFLFLEELKLHVNYFEKLDFCQFDCLRHLEKLDLSLNRIEKLVEGVFSKLKRLKWLDLRNNPILDLGSNAFRGLENLEILILNEINERKKFNRIEKDAFNGLTNLKSLSLEGNHLKYIDPEAFSHTPKLNELSLKYNGLESIDPKLFSYTPNLVKLEISHNKMKLEKDIFANLKHLKQIT